MSDNKKFTIKYAAVQGFYWAAFCSLLGFIVIFLLDRGYTNSEIGIIIALSNVAAVFLQPMIASFADKYEKVTLKRIIWVWASVILLTSAGLTIIGGASLLVSAFITLSLIGIMVIQPFVNTMSVQLEERGIFINFGVCRACGSFCYAMVSTVMGVLLKYNPTALIPLSAVILTLGLFVSVGILAGSKGEWKKGRVNKKKDGQEKKAQGLVSFLASHKKFFVFLIGISFSQFLHILTIL